jgi:hypothetical protein
MPHYLGYVNDGCTLTGTINEVANLHSALRMTYRPMTAEEYAQHNQDMVQLNEVQANQLLGAEFVAHVRSWDLKDVKGNPVPLSLDSVKKIVRPLFVRAWRIMAGMEGPDSLEGQTATEAKALLDDRIRALAESRRLGDVTEEREVKN